MTRILTAIAMCPLLAASAGAAAECYESSIVSPTPFKGVHGEVFKVADGSLWEVQHEYEYLYQHKPQVVLCPNRGELLIDDRALRVMHVSGKRYPSVAATEQGESAEPIESIIDGDFDGWEGETIVKLANGQVWQQQDEQLHTNQYAFMPKVVIYRSPEGYRMKVDGIERAVAVIKLN